MITMTGEGYCFKLLENKNMFNIIKGAPSEWSKAQGATHSILLENGGTRAAKLAKTRAYVGVGEDDEGKIVWEKWGIRIIGESTKETVQNTIWYYTKLWKNSGFKHLEALANWKPV